MATLLPLLKDIRGVHSDRARDRLPAGSVWVMRDWVPLVEQAAARIRGAWKYQSPPLSAVPDGMLYAPFRAGSRLLVANGTSLHSVPVDTVGATLIGTTPQTRQNPTFWRNRAIIPAANGTSPARFVVFDGTTYTLTDAPASALTGRYTCVWKDRLVIANSAADPTAIGYSKNGDPTITWDSLSLLHASYEITGLAGQRTQVLAFHASSVERFRGTTPPDSSLSDQTGDLLLDFLWDRAGCYDARSICNWNDNVVFADARGIWLTDGATVRNLTFMSGALNLWSDTFERNGQQPLSISGVVHKTYYLCTVRHTDLTPITFVVELENYRVWVFTNIDATTLAYSIGVGEKVYGTDAATMRVTDLTPSFDPDPTVFQIDGNGTAVLPYLSSGWSLITDKPGYKRVHDLHFSYLATRDDDAEVLRASYGNTPTGGDQVLGELRPKRDMIRLSMPVRRRMEGISVTLEQLQPTKDTRLNDISIRAFPEPQSRT